MSTGRTKKRLVFAGCRDDMTGKIEVMLVLSSNDGDAANSGYKR